MTARGQWRPFIIKPDPIPYAPRSRTGRPSRETVTTLNHLKKLSTEAPLREDREPARALVDSAVGFHEQLLATQKEDIR